MYVFYTNLICIAFTFLYRPPNGTPPAAAAVSFAKFSDEDTSLSICLVTLRVPFK